MGGPGLLALLGKAKSLSKLDTPKNKKILVDVEAYHQLLVRACFNASPTFDAVKFVTNSLLQKFAGTDVEYFLDGYGNQEKHLTSMQRRNRNTQLDAVEERIALMEDRASEGLGIRKADFKFVQNTLKKSTPVTLEFKRDLFDALRARGAIVVFDDGEADISIRHRAQQLLGEGIDFVVVGNDCDYAIHPTTTILLRPWGRDKFLEYDISVRLKEASFSRSQYQALGVISHTDYTWNLPRLGIGNNSRIIKSISSGKFVYHPRGRCR